MSQKKKVLVVDDDDAIRTMVERVLRREHFEVESARDGFEAIEKLSSNDYATILLDLMMPRVDGHGVLRFLETERTEFPPVIVMTANLPGALETQAAKPVFRVLSKPFDITQLVTHVKECLTPAEKAEKAEKASRARAPEQPPQSSSSSVDV
ncbi:MAG TPA: response regulator [Thermoanaerobaculia bacterium]|nr:response regulator [Thermoanaerobaculia bacterium]